LFEPDPSVRIGLEMLQELRAGVVITESAARYFSVEGAFSDLTVRATGEEATRCRTAAITVFDILRLKVQTVLLATNLSDPGRHRLTFDGVLLQGRQMNGAIVTSQAAICNHGVHGLFLPGISVGQVVNLSYKDRVIAAHPPLTE
jgi:hypothetical protein